MLATSIFGRFRLQSAQYIFLEIQINSKAGSTILFNRKEESQELYYVLARRVTQKMMKTTKHTTGQTISIIFQNVSQAHRVKWKSENISVYPYYYREGSFQEIVSLAIIFMQGTHLLVILN